MKRLSNIKQRRHMSFHAQIAEYRKNNPNWQQEAAAEIAAEQEAMRVAFDKATLGILKAFQKRLQLIVEKLAPGHQEPIYYDFLTSQLGPISEESASWSVVAALAHKNPAMRDIWGSGGSAWLAVLPWGHADYDFERAEFVRLTPEESNACDDLRSHPYFKYYLQGFDSSKVSKYRGGTVDPYFLISSSVWPPKETL